MQKKKRASVTKTGKKKLSKVKQVQAKKSIVSTKSGVNKFVSLRTKKLKSWVGNNNSIQGAINHNNRLAETPNADPAKTNIYYGSSDPVSDIQKLHKELDITYRNTTNEKQKSVLANEVLISFSPEIFSNLGPEQTKKMGDDIDEFLKNQFGRGYISGAWHLDETTPHFQAIITPIYHGKERRNSKESKWHLSAKHYFDNGTKDTPPELQKCSIWQDKIADFLQSKGWDVERGIKGSKAIHKDISNWYKELNESVERAQKEAELATQEATQIINEEQPGMFSFMKLKEYANRAVEELKKTTKLVSDIRTAMLTLQKTSEDKIRALEDRISDLIDKLKLTPEQIDDLQMVEQKYIAEQSINRDLQQQLKEKDENHRIELESVKSQRDFHMARANDAVRELEAAEEGTLVADLRKKNKSLSLQNESLKLKLEGKRLTS